MNQFYSNLFTSTSTIDSSVRYFASVCNCWVYWECIIENKAAREIAGGREKKFSLLLLRHPLLTHCDTTTLLPVLVSCGAFCNNVPHVYQQRHRMVMDILKGELETGVHALSIQVIADSVRVGTLKSSDGLTIESLIYILGQICFLCHSVQKKK